MWSIYGRSRHTIPNNRATTHVPSAQPIAIKNPHTNQTNNALAEITGTISRPPFDSAELFGSALVQYETTAKTRQYLAPPCRP
jgi:hypothetical protein